MAPDEERHAATARRAPRQCRSGVVAVPGPSRPRVANQPESAHESGEPDRLPGMFGLSAIGHEQPRRPVPAIAAQFDPGLNGGRRAGQVLARTGEVVTWRCDRGPDHVWAVSVVSRTAQGNGCPACAGKQVSVTNMLARYPELVGEFDFAANAPETPETLSESSQKRAWWRCPLGPDHKWRARVSVTNSLATCCPQAAGGLDPALNDGLTAEQVTARSNRIVTWSCPDSFGHTWQTTVGSRVARLAVGHGGCPQCQPRGDSQRQLADRGRRGPTATAATPLQDAPAAAPPHLAA